MDVIFEWPYLWQSTTVFWAIALLAFILTARLESKTQKTETEHTRTPQFCANCFAAIPELLHPDTQPTSVLQQTVQQSEDPL